jgi:hypothetical protein
MTDTTSTTYWRLEFQINKRGMFIHAHPVGWMLLTYTTPGKTNRRRYTNDHGYAFSTQLNAVIAGINWLTTGKHP